MRSITFVNLFVSLLSIIPKIHAEPDPNFHVYLAFGQSNMEGQAQIGKLEETPAERFKMLPTGPDCNDREMGTWYDAIPPLAHCHAAAGIVDYFGRKMVEELPDVTIGVAVIAISGGEILLFDRDDYERWANKVQYHWYQRIIDYYGRNPYGRLIEVGKRAQQDGVIKGILVHQGENDAAEKNWPYDLKRVYENILEDLNLKAEEVPLLVGELVYTELCGKQGKNNPNIRKIADLVPTAHIISAEGLKPLEDCLHFNHDSYVEFGNRYAQTMLNILNGTMTSNHTVSGNDTSSLGNDATTSVDKEKSASMLNSGSSMSVPFALFTTITLLLVSILFNF